MNKILKLLGTVTLTNLAGIIGSFATRANIPDWYQYLEKPPFNPPSWVFGPVWTALYTLMGISLYLVMQSGVRSKTRAYAAFSVQLVLNALWSFAFFGAKSPELGIVVILPLLVAIAWTMYEFNRINKKAAWLLLPYLAWTSFATVLTISIAMLN